MLEVYSSRYLSFSLFPSYVECLCHPINPSITALTNLSIFHLCIHPSIDSAVNPCIYINRWSINPSEPLNHPASKDHYHLFFFFSNPLFHQFIHSRILFASFHLPISQIDNPSNFILLTVHPPVHPSIHVFVNLHSSIQ